MPRDSTSGGGVFAAGAVGCACARSSSQWKRSMVSSMNGRYWPIITTMAIAPTRAPAIVAVSTTSPTPISPRAARITTQPIAAT